MRALLPAPHRCIARLTPSFSFQLARILCDDDGGCFGLRSARWEEEDGQRIRSRHDDASVRPLLPSSSLKLTILRHRQRVLTDKCGLQTLGRRMGLDRELQSIVDSLGPDGKRAAGVRKGKKRKAVGRGLGRAAKRQVIDRKSVV